MNFFNDLTQNIQTRVAQVLQVVDVLGVNFVEHVSQVNRDVCADIGNPHRSPY